MSTLIVPRAEALRKPTHHQYVRGVGYVRHPGPPELPPSAGGQKNCSPPQGTRDGTFHLLRPPTGGLPMVFAWVMREQAWAATNPGKGNRLAWPASHLQRAGWEYVRMLAR